MSSKVPADRLILDGPGIGGNLSLWIAIAMSDPSPDICRTLVRRLGARYPEPRSVCGAEVSR